MNFPESDITDKIFNRESMSNKISSAMPYIACTIAFFLALKNNCITGPVFSVDGGLSFLIPKNRQMS